MWHSQRGDTIVEVLIAVSIASLVLASAYAVTNRNVLAIQQAQEQAYGQKIVQQQVEYLRAAPGLATSPGCYTAPSTYSTAPADCDIPHGGATYALQISPGATNAVKATWDSLGGASASIVVYYRAAT